MEKAMKEELAKAPPAPGSQLFVGETYKITGGKYKKFKTGILENVNDTYSDVKVRPQSSSGVECPDKVVKVKNIYLLRHNPPGIEMPTEDDLLVVDNLDEYLEHHPECMPEDIKVEVNEDGHLVEVVEEEDTTNETLCDLVGKLEDAGETGSIKNLLQKSMAEIDRLKEQLNNEVLFSKMLLDKISK